MNKYLSTGLLALTVGVVGFGAGLATQGVSAHAEGGKGAFKPLPPEDVEREVTYLDNGVQIEITSDDPEEVERIQERHTNEVPNNGNRPEDAPEVDFNVELIDDGVLITITTDDEEAVEKIQENADHPVIHGPHEHHCEPREEDDDEALE